LTAVELAPEVTASLCAMKNRGTPPTRCHKGVIQSAIAGGVRRLVEGAPDSVLAALGIAKPKDVELEVVSEDLGQGETETRYCYQWTEGGRSILAEKVKNEIYDGATPYSTYVRGVIVDCDRGALLTGSGDSALVIEG
jgi:hypothetical protein